MQRRRFLQSLIGALAAPLLSVPIKQDEPPIAQTYTDSDANTPAALAALHDGDRQTGGIAYNP